MLSSSCRAESHHYLNLVRKRKITLQTRNAVLFLITTSEVVDVLYCMFFCISVAFVGSVILFQSSAQSSSTPPHQRLAKILNVLGQYESQSQSREDEENNTTDSKFRHNNIPEEVKVADKKMLDILSKIVGVYDTESELFPLRFPNATQFGKNNVTNFDGDTRFPFKSTRPFSEGEDELVKDELVKRPNGKYPFAEKFSNTVVMLFASAKHAMYVYNWICWTRDYNFKFMVVSANEELHRNLTSMGYLSYLYPEETTTEVRRGGEFSRDRL